MLLMVVAEISDFKDKSVMELVSKSINFRPLFTEKFGTNHVYYHIFAQRRIEGKRENLFKSGQQVKPFECVLSS